MGCFYRFCVLCSLVDHSIENYDYHSFQQEEKVLHMRFNEYCKEQVGIIVKTETDDTLSVKHHETSSYTSPVKTNFILGSVVRLIDIQVGDYIVIRTEQNDIYTDKKRFFFDVSRVKQVTETHITVYCGWTRMMSNHIVSEIRDEKADIVFKRETSALWYSGHVCFAPDYQRAFQSRWFQKWKQWAYDVYFTSLKSFPIVLLDLIWDQAALNVIALDINDEHIQKYFQFIKKRFNDIDEDTNYFDRYVRVLKYLRIYLRSEEKHRYVCNVKDEMHMLEDKIPKIETGEGFLMIPYGY
jgi:hypothetical protein